jgi:hypothetical protein
MTKATTKAKTIWMPGKERPAASRLVIQRPRRRSLTKRISAKTKPSAGQPVGPTAEGLDHRFLRSQPRVIGPGSLRKARPWQSEYKLTTQPDALNLKTNSGDTNSALPKHLAAR